MLRAPGVVLINPKFPHNVGGTIRACSCFGIESLVWTGLRVDASKYRRLPREERMKGYKSVVFSNNQRPFYLFEDFTPVCVEVFEQSEPLTTFEHPEKGGLRVRTRRRWRAAGHRGFVSSIRSHPVALLPESERGCERGVGASLYDATVNGQASHVAVESDAARTARRFSDSRDGCGRMGR